eukprot:scaffold4092_cov63-Isochrysis_galbana.AAC.1
MEMDYAGVGRDLGLLYMLPYYFGMALVLPFASQPLRVFEPNGVPWRKVIGITIVDFASQVHPSSVPRTKTKLGSGPRAPHQNKTGLWPSCPAPKQNGALALVPRTKKRTGPLPSCPASKQNWALALVPRTRRKLGSSP